MLEKQQNTDGLKTNLEPDNAPENEQKAGILLGFMRNVLDDWENIANKESQIESLLHQKSNEKNWQFDKEDVRDSQGAMSEFDLRIAEMRMDLVALRKRFETSFEALLKYLDQLPHSEDIKILLEKRFPTSLSKLLNGLRGVSFEKAIAVLQEIDDKMNIATFINSIPETKPVPKIIIPNKQEDISSKDKSPSKDYELSSPERKEAAHARVRNDLRVHIRWMIRRDMPEVLQIEQDSFDYPWTEEDFLRCLRQRNAIGMVAEHVEKIVGFMIYELHKSKLHILNFCTHVAGANAWERKWHKNLSVSFQATGVITSPLKYAKVIWYRSFFIEMPTLGLSESYVSFTQIPAKTPTSCNTVTRALYRIKQPQSG